MSRAYLNSVRSPRITLRTVARDTESALTISLIEHPCSKYARRISPILSTPNIPHPSFPADPGQRKNAHTQVRRGRYWTRKQPFRGSLLQAILQLPDHSLDEEPIAQIAVAPNMSGTTGQQFFKPRELVAAQSMTAHRVAFQRRLPTNQTFVDSRIRSAEKMSSHIIIAIFSQLIEDTPLDICARSSHFSSGGDSFTRSSRGPDRTTCTRSGAIRPRSIAIFR